MAKKPDKNKATGTIALNKRARHEYHLEQRYEAGIALQGWELKAIRAGRANITEAYAVIRHGELFLFGAQITPLIQASSHVVTNDRRNSKLLLHRREIDKLFGMVNQKGHTCVALKVYWSHGRVKCEIALAKGKKLHDKRATLKERDYQREKQRGLKNLV